MRWQVLDRCRGWLARLWRQADPGGKLRWQMRRQESRLRRLGYAAARLSRRRAARLARSRRLDRLTRGLPMLVMLGGLYLILLGAAVGLGQFSAGVSRLVDIAGLHGMAASSAQFVQNRVAALFGFSPPVMVLANSHAPTQAPGEGFVPYQVAAGVQEQAPALAGDAVATAEAPAAPTGQATHPVVPVTAAQDAPPTTPADPAASAPTAEPPAPAPNVNPAAAAPTATAEPLTPDRIRIPAIGLDAPVVLAPRLSVTVAGQSFVQWDAPGYFAAGWQEGSAPLGQPGNTVINGHHNIDGEVFAHLRDLSPGDEISVSSGERVFQYAVVQVMKLRERNMPLAQRQENARWIMPSSDERLTLVTCWPPDNNTYRLIVVAVPRGQK